MRLWIIFGEGWRRWVFSEEMPKTLFYFYNNLFIEFIKFSDCGLIESVVHKEEESCLELFHD